MANVRAWLCDSLILPFPDCRETCVPECVFGSAERNRGSVSVCMTRGCIRRAGIESLERRGRAGVTNQLWESRLEKTHPLFSPKREREGTDKTNLSRPKPLQINGYHQKYLGEGEKKLRSPPLQSASHSPLCFSSLWGLLREVHKTRGLPF